MRWWCCFVSMGWMAGWVAYEIRMPANMTAPGGMPRRRVRYVE